jgi:hypothetical protein
VIHRAVDSFAGAIAVLVNEVTTKETVSASTVIDRPPAIPREWATGHRILLVEPDAAIIYSEVSSNDVTADLLVG